MPDEDHTAKRPSLSDCPFCNHDVGLILVEGGTCWAVKCNGCGTVATPKPLAEDASVQWEMGAAPEGVATTELERQIAAAVRAGVAKSIEDSLTGYKRPLSELTDRVLATREADFSAVIGCGLDAILGEPAFAEEVEAAIRSKLARQLVGALGGEIEKRINDLRANPATRARLTLALEAMLDEQLAGKEG
jgi:hypothetical protein